MPSPPLPHPLPPSLPPSQSPHTKSVPHLQDLLNISGNVIVLLPHHIGVHDTRGGVKRIHRWIDTQLCNHTHTERERERERKRLRNTAVLPRQPTGDGSGEDGGGVQVSKGGGWGGVSEVVCRHEDGLHRGDGALLGAGDPLLHGAHVRGQRRLVTHG